MSYVFSKCAGGLELLRKGSFYGSLWTLGLLLPTRALITLSLFSSLAAAQQVRIVETLPNDQFIVEINGKEYRALNADKVAELAKQKIDLEATQKINAELGIQIKEALLQRDLAQAQKDLEAQKAASFESDFKRAREGEIRNFNLFMSERELRVEASQFIPHGKTSGFWGKVLTALDSPQSQAFWKLAVPTYQMIRCQ